MITQANYLDIGNLLINELIGDVWLVLIIGVLLIVYFGVKNSMDFKAIFGLLFVFSIGLAGYYYNSAILSLTALVIGFVGYGIWAKYVGR